MCAEKLREESLMEGIPILDIGRFGHNPDDDRRFADELGEVCREISFMSFVEHDVDPATVSRAFAVMQAVFLGMTLEERLRYESRETGHQLGFTPPDTEVSVGQAKANRMQYWHVMDPETGVKNIFPNEVKEFERVMLEMHAVLKRFGQRVLRAIAVHLRRHPEYFARWTENGENLLRAIHYPALDGTEDVPRSGEHEDINLITTLVPATEPGLQVKTRSGRWIDANNPPGSIIVNLGDMMQLHTFGEFKSTTHRVMTPRHACTDRFSIPEFIHPEIGQALVTAKAYKFRRLRDNRVLAALPYPEIDH